MLTLAVSSVPFSQAVVAAFGDKQDVDDKRRSSLFAGPRGLCRGQEAEQPCHHAG